MRAVSVASLAVVLLVGCGRTERHPSSRDEEPGAPGAPVPAVTPNPAQSFAFGLASHSEDERPAMAYACTSEGAIPLGPSVAPLGQLSPDGRHWAVARGDGVDVIEAPSLTSQRLAGDEVDLGTLRWSDDGGRLAYFAQGFPMLAEGDGTRGEPLAVTLPDPDDEVELPLVDWSPSGESVGFLARGMAMVAARDGSDARVLWRRAARVTIPRGLALSHDGRVAAVVDDANRRLILIDTSTSSVVETELFDTATIDGWLPGDEWLLTSGRDALSTLVGRDGISIELPGRAAASPVSVEVAVSDTGIKVLRLPSAREQALAASALDSGPLFYRGDGRAIQYLDVSTVRVVSTADGRQLAENETWGSFGPGEWFAAPRAGVLRLFELVDDGLVIEVPSSLPVKLAEGGGSWLADERFALADDAGVHLISLDGRIDDVCPEVRRVSVRQAPRTNAY